MFAQGGVGARLAADPGHSALTHQLPTSDRWPPFPRINPETNPMSASGVAIILQPLHQLAPLHGAQWFHHPSEQFTEERKRETKAPFPAEASSL